MVTCVVLLLCELGQDVLAAYIPVMKRLPHMRRRTLAQVAHDHLCARIASLQFIHNGTRCLMRMRITPSRTAFDQQNLFHFCSLSFSFFSRTTCTIFLALVWFAQYYIACTAMLFRHDGVEKWNCGICGTSWPSVKR